MERFLFVSPRIATLCYVHLGFVFVLVAERSAAEGSVGQIFKCLKRLDDFHANPKRAGSVGKRRKGFGDRIWRLVESLRFACLPQNPRKPKENWPLQRPSRQFANLCWRSRGYSNHRSGFSETPFEISAEFRLREREIADREKIAQELSNCRCTSFSAILRLHNGPRNGSFKRKGVPTSPASGAAKSAACARTTAVLPTGCNLRRGDRRPWRNPGGFTRLRGVDRLRRAAVRHLPLGAAR